MSVEKNPIQEEPTVQTEEIHETEDITKETEEQIENDEENSGNPIEVELQEVKQQKVELEAKLEEAENGFFVCKQTLKIPVAVQD